MEAATTAAASPRRQRCARERFRSPGLAATDTSIAQSPFGWVQHPGTPKGSFKKSATKHNHAVVRRIDSPPTQLRPRTPNAFANKLAATTCKSHSLSWGSLPRWKQSFSLPSDRDCRRVVYELVARSFAQNHGRGLIPFCRLIFFFDGVQGDSGRGLAGRNSDLVMSSTKRVIGSSRG